MTDVPVVYVIDDDASFRKAVSRLLRSAGLEVEALASAGEFLARPEVDRPACLVLDVRMPGPSGMDLQAALQKAQRDIPIVFMTGYGNVSTGVRAMKGGAVDFLEKPFRGRELLACVQRGLARSQQSWGERAERAAVAPIPTIFITVHDDPVTRERARSGVAYLRKPFREDALIGAIQQALEGRRA